MPTNWKSENQPFTVCCSKKTETMLVRSNDPGQILAAVDLLNPQNNETLMLLVAESNAPDIPELMKLLNKRGIVFFGGIFPGLIYRNSQVSEGVILKKFTHLLPPVCVTGIASCQFDGFEPMETFRMRQRGTAIILVDGLTPNIYRFLERLNDLLGEHCNFIGAGAGSISLEQQPCIFSNAGLVKDAAVVCVIDREANLGVRHGWEQLEGPLVATQTDGNTIGQLNWQPAIEVYAGIVERAGGGILNEANFASIAQGFPFGILREKEDDIVRDPLAIGPDGSIICIGEVPPNTVLHVLKGEPNALIGAAKAAVADCLKNTRDVSSVRETFVVDCITRVLYLDDRFADEINSVRDNLAIQSPEQEPFGVLSLGEISSYGEGLLELFNKTIVVGVFN